LLIEGLHSEEILIKWGGIHLGVNVEVNFGRERCIFGLNHKTFGNKPHE